MAFKEKSGTQRHSGFEVYPVQTGACRTAIFRLRWMIQNHNRDSRDLPHCRVGGRGSPFSAHRSVHMTQTDARGIVCDADNAQAPGITFHSTATIGAAERRYVNND